MSATDETRPGNIFDLIAEAAGEDNPLWAGRTPRRPDASYDIRLIPRTRDWRDDRASQAALDQIEAAPWVREARRTDSGVDLAVDDRWIAVTGAELEAGGSVEASLADLVPGRRYAVQFWDANATKALHVGHLRNLSTGNAIASALAQAGGLVERRSLISDTGRSMAEAMAGVKMSGRLAEEWAGEKSDHFVGVCYAAYVADCMNGDAPVAEDPEHPEASEIRELTVHEDSADQLLQGILSGDPATIELWYRTRAWVIAGQRKTLARLGVPFDRVYFESDFLDEAFRFAEQGLRDGWLQRRDDGVLVHVTGSEDYEDLPLVRPDGLPTQHMRAFIYWMTAPEMEGMTTMQVMGSEWTASVASRRRLQNRLAAGGEVHPTFDIANAMVARQKRALSSSEGALLIDDLIEWLDRRIKDDPECDAMRATHPAPDRIAPQIAAAYFLPYSMTKPIDFEPEHLLRDRDSLGWDLARARAPRATTEGDRQPVEDPDYRFAVVQSELYRRHLRHAVERYDVGQLALYLKHIAQWHLEGERSAPVERVVHTLLDRSARGLGLEVVR